MALLAGSSEGKNALQKAAKNGHAKKLAFYLERLRMMKPRAKQQQDVVTTAVLSRDHDGLDLLRHIVSFESHDTSVNPKIAMGLDRGFL